jgi:serine/threonine protein kinase
MEDINTNIQYAVKVIDKKALEKKQRGFKKDLNGDLILNPLLQNALREIAILKKLNNPHIIKLSEIIHDDEFGKIYMVLEVCNRGSIMKYDEFTGEFTINDYYIKEDTRKFDYSEEELRDFVRGIVIGLEYLHANNIVHRDIKPDNILLSENGEIKITDFNVSKTLEGEDDSKDKETEGTVYFMAPEMCEGRIKNYYFRKFKKVCWQTLGYLGPWCYPLHFDL